MNSSSLYHKHPIKGGRDDQRWQNIPKNSLDKLLLRLIRHSRLRARELILERPFAMESTIFSHHFSSQAKPSHPTHRIQNVHHPRLALAREPGHKHRHELDQVLHGGPRGRPRESVQDPAHHGLPVSVHEGRLRVFQCVIRGCAHYEGVLFVTQGGRGEDGVNTYTEW